MHESENISNQKTIDKLQSFNETVDQLQGFSFWKSFPKKSGYNIVWDNTPEGVKINFQVFGPNDESISAFILKYRLFLQDKDDISIRNLDKIYLGVPIEPENYHKFKVLKQKINDTLDKPSNATIKKHIVTVREIHDMFIYGHWAHMTENDKNRKRYLSIKDHPVFYPIFANTFIATLVKIMNELVQIKFLNEEVIKKLEAQ